MNISSTLTTAIEATGSMQQAEIKVTVPTSSEFVINPYKLSATVKDTSGSDVTKSTQVVSPDYTVTNAGEVDLQVDATIKATVGDGLALATGPVASTSTKKEVFLFVNFKRSLDSAKVSGITGQSYTAAGAPIVNDNTTLAADGSTVLYAIDKAALEQDTSDTSGTTYKIKNDYVALIKADPYAYTLKTSTGSYTNTSTKVKTSYVLETYSFLKEGEYNKDANQGAATTAGTTYKNVGTIANKGETDGTSLIYTILGSTAVNPSGGWKGDESAKVTITFNFTPVVK
jgi:hypothetical protein